MKKDVRLNPSTTPDKNICQQCGACCRKYTPIEPTVVDLKRWIDEGRYEILKYMRVLECNHTNGTYRDTRADMLMFETDFGDVVEIELVDPLRHRPYEKRCPFLKMKFGKHICSIHTTKPQICRDYRPWEWLEKGDNIIEQLHCPVVQNQLNGD